MHRHASSAVGLVIVTLLLTAQPSDAAKAEPFSLAQAIPDDVILYVAERPNPERAFVRAYWQEVLDALVDSGVPRDFLALVVGMLDLEEQQQAELDRLEARARELAAGVDWAGLGSVETAFAERLVVPQELRPDPFIATPDMVWLARGTKESAAANADGLAAILQALAEEVNKAADRELLVVTKAEKLGARVTTLEAVDEHTRMRVSIGSKSDLVIMGIGETLLDQVLDLLAAKKPKKSPSLANSERFRQAFVGLPAPDDMVTYFDMQRMLGGMRRLIDAAMSKASEPRDTVLNASGEPGAMELYKQAVTKYGEGDVNGALELTREARKIAPHDPRILYNLACFEALADNPAEAVTLLGHAVEAGFYSPDKIAEDADLDSIRDTEGYRAAHARATELAAGRASGWAEDVKKLVDRILGVPGMIDHVASVSSTEGYSVYTETITRLVEDAASHPFYPVLASATTTGDFATFLPQEAASFSVSAGIDLEALVSFVEDSVRLLGGKGEQALEHWQQMQTEWGFDLKRDVVDWVEGSMITVTLDEGKGSAWLLGVRDEAVARDKVKAALDVISAKVAKVAEQNPAAAMVNLRRAPATEPALEGFESVFIGISPKPITWGVARGHLVLGTADAIVACLATASGDHRAFEKSERAMQEMLAPKAEFSAVSLTDHRQLGKQLATALGIGSMVGAMMGAQVKDAEARETLSKLVAMIPRLTPVVSEIDFIRSTAGRTSFDGKGWRNTKVTHYRAPAPPEPEQPPAVE